MKVVYEAVLVREDGGDFDVREFSTLKDARIGLRDMVDGKPFSDAYIRRFTYDEYGFTIDVRDFTLTSYEF